MHFQEYLHHAANADEIIHVLKWAKIDLFDCKMDRQEFIDAAKRKRDSNRDEWTMDVRKEFGKCLKVFELAQKVRQLRETLDPATNMRNDNPSTHLHGCGSVGAYTLWRDITLLRRVKYVTSGGTYAAAVTASGLLYTMGSNTYGQLGHTPNANSVDKFRMVKDVMGIVNVVGAGYAFCFAQTQGGVCYAWGSADNGRLATEVEGDNCILPPTVVEFPETLRVIAAGSMHACAVGQSGLVYTWGYYIYNGLGNDVDTATPCVMECLSGTSMRHISIGVGGYHTLCLSIEGDLYGWGHNRVGQLGLKIHPVEYIVPTPVFLRPAVAWMDAGWGHCVLVDFQSHVYAAGRNTSGQVGVPPEKSIINSRGHACVDSFTRIPLPPGFKLLNVSCGGEHVSLLGMTGDGDRVVVQWGNFFEFMDTLEQDSDDDSYHTLRQLDVGFFKRGCTMDIESIASGTACLLFLATHRVSAKKED